MIPKTLMQTSRDAADPYMRVQLFRYLGSDWTYVHFTDSQILEYFQNNPIDEFPRIADVFHAMPTGAHKADLFRYYFLYLNGGVFMDYDALLKQNIDHICASNDFFTVRSGYLANTVFQGFLGATPRHELMHAALTDAYRADPAHLKDNYLGLCANFGEIIRNFPEKDRITLLHEILYTNGISEVVDDTGTIILLHYYQQRAVPGILGTSWAPCRQ